jgi:multiple sugar transport system substrate-binding protein
MTRHTTRAVLGTGAVLLAGALVLAGCGSGFAGDDNAAPDAEGLTSSDDALTVLIGSSGDAETAGRAGRRRRMVRGIRHRRSPSRPPATSTRSSRRASPPESPPTCSTSPPTRLAGYASNGSLQAYGDHLANKDDFYPSLVENFTIDDTFYCAPKDFSTLALIINTQMWSDAGLTDADLPKTWDDLAAVAQKLTTADHVGSAFGASTSASARSWRRPAAA